MPISSKGSYLSTMQDFIAHWADVAAAIAPDSLVLKGGYTLANFTTDRDGIQAAITAIEPVDNARQGVATDRDLKKAALKIRLAQFRAAIITLLPGTTYASMLPNLPGFKDVESRFLRPFDDAANIWARVNVDVIPGFVKPLLLAGGYTLANFNADLAALRAAYIAFTNASNDSQQARRARDILLPPAKERMKQYRQAVKFKLVTGHALLLNVPILTPPPGSTPAAPNLSGAWNLTDADLTWTHPNVAQVDHWEIRYHPGPTYKASEEQAVPGGNLPVGTLSFSTDFGLPAPGSVAWYKDYAVTAAGNEKGSNGVKIVRPA